jgi:PAS domain S-box-containing protein
MRTVDQQLASAFNQSQYHVEIYREYLETILFPGAESQTEIREALVRKYKNQKIDLIVAVGPSPIQFLVDSSDRFFPTIPVVVCVSIRAVVQNPNLDPRFTGVWEKPDPSKTVDVALRLLPNTKHVVVVGGTSVFDRQMEALIGESLRTYEQKVDISYLVDLDMSELIHRLANLPKDTIVLTAHMSQDVAGTRFTADTESSPTIVAASNAPVFTTIEPGWGHGEVGGYFKSISSEARTAAEIAVRILKGEKPQNILRVGTSSYYFDWRALQRWKLDPTKLPEGSVLINKEPTLWESYRRYLVPTFFLLSLQTTIIVALLYQKKIRRKAQTELALSHAQLRESEGRFRLVADTAPVMIWLTGPDKLCTYVNQSWLAFTGRTFEQELGYGWVEGINSADVERCLDVYTHAFERRDPFQTEYRIRRKDGEYRWILDAGVPRFKLDGTFAGYIGSAMDVTEQKQAEEALSTVSQRLIEAHEHERTSIARELHDDINQRLALAAVTLDDVVEHLDISPTQLKSEMNLLKEQIRDLCRDLQTVSHRLHNSKLEQLGLKVSAESFCNEFSERNKVQVVFRAENIPNGISTGLALCLFRVLQEGLQNAVKHSGVTVFEVLLKRQSDQLQLTIRDSGKGFNTEDVLKSHGIGFAGMRERLKLVHGYMSIRSKRGEGTTLCATVPLESPPDQVPRSGETVNFQKQLA